MKYILVAISLIVGLLFFIKPYLINSKSDTLFEAVVNKDMQKVSELIQEGVYIDTKDKKNGWTPLAYAAILGDIDIVKMLLENGADVEKRANDGATILIIATTSKKENLDVIKLLISYGADVNAKANDGSTPLMSATFSGNENIVKYLIDKGADVNVKAENGMSALKIAKMLGHGKIVKILIDAGAK